MWVENIEGKFLYKENKKFVDGSYTYESDAEYVAKQIGDMIKVPVVDIERVENKAILSKVMTDDTLHSFMEYDEENINSFHLSDLNTFNIARLLQEEKEDILRKSIICCYLIF